MKRLLIAIMLAGGFANAATAAPGEIVWQGDIFVKTVTAGCQGSWAVGNFSRAVFKPANLGTNGADTKLSLIGTRNGQRYFWPGAKFGNGAIGGTGIGTTANVFTWTSNFSKATTQPATPTATTQTVVLKATITNFFNNPGCTVTVIGSLGLRPDL
jgi:hypothetical protein